MGVAVRQVCSCPAVGRARWLLPAASHLHSSGCHSEATQHCLNIILRLLLSRPCKETTSTLPSRTSFCCAHTRERRSRCCAGHSVAVACEREPDGTGSIVSGHVPSNAIILMLLSTQRQLNEERGGCPHGHHLGGAHANPPF